ncbi:junctional cadherin 5-associated protein [Tiliqua scincoides]|uniref:junctional cadherin 5-associated protein n=1 Tax=Tiliqua scincoides TaxID=71010 RepID=UPI0034633FE6
MFSVEDLLISHGYKLSKNPTNLYDNRCDRFHHETADRRATHGTVNGFPTNSGAYVESKTTGIKSYLNDNENSHVLQGRQLSPIYHKDVQGLANTHASEGGFYTQPPLSWSSRPKQDKDLAYWRRRGQDFSILFSHTDQRGSEMKDTAVPYASYGHDKESQWEVGGGIKSVRRTGVQENWKSGDYRSQSLRSEHLHQPVKFGGFTSEADRGRLLEDMYSVRQGDAAVASHAKGKSQSLPRVLSPESLRFVEMPSLVNSKPSLSGTKTSSCPQTGLALETSRHSDLSAHFLPLPKPKYGRPLKPPSYELHQQTRGTPETSLLQDDQRKDEAISYLTKANEQTQDTSIQDSGLEPPLYIPPPCYKSPAQQSMNQHLPSEVPEYDVCFNNGMQSPLERTVPGYQASPGTFGIGAEPCKDEQFPCDKRSYSRYGEGFLSSVQYIPFDDPRIRHIKIAPPDDLKEDDRITGDANRVNSSAFPESALELEYKSAFFDMSDLRNAAVKRDPVLGSSAHSSRWLAESSVEKDNCTSSIQRDVYDAGNDQSHRCPKGRLSATSPQTEPFCETVTKVKTFEPGTEVQNKRSSKKKMNETIFCLVSIPVKFELNLPDTDRNNNLTQGAAAKNGLDNSGVLQEQSLLSTSSTDLELQALTGSMTNRNELQKQELQRPEFKQTNDLRFQQPAKHKELQYSGSWPGDQYKDQQTQTSFTEEPKVLRLVRSLEPSGPSKMATSQVLRDATSAEDSALTMLPADDRKCRQAASFVKSQCYLDKSGNGVCYRTATLSGKASQNLPCTGLSGQERETSSVLGEEGGVPCSSKELFGQFLLKPVGRRPWDIISELESFNKELQEQEESSENGVENESKQERDEEKEGTKGSGNRKTTGPTQYHSRPGMQSEMVMPVTPVGKQGREKSKSESLSVSDSSSARVIPSDFFTHPQSSLKAKEMGVMVRSVDGYVVAEQRKQEAGKRTIKQAGSPVKKVLVSSCDDENHYNPFNSILFREENKVKNHRDNIVDFDRMKINAAPRNNLALERGSLVRLSLTNRNQGLSEPDLRSVGLDGDDQGPGALQLDCNGKPIDPEIPPNESLQARAARILGIDVAVESLMPNNRTFPNEHAHSENLLQSFERVAEKVHGGRMETKAMSYEGRRKCGWTESSLFVGDRNVLSGSVEDQDAGQETVCGAQNVMHHKGLGRQRDQTFSLESTVLPPAERNTVLPSVEKRGRSTSKVIETLQGKLASPPSRAAMDRLVRMKEVDSVSRMRRLSIKNADSSEDQDEDKHSKGSEEKGSDTPFGGSDPPRRLSHGSSVFKRIISLAENGLLDNLSEKKPGRDLFCLDTYDPTRVERV